MARRSIYSGSKFEEIAGYARAVIDGEFVFVSGTAGYDPASMHFPAGAAAQATQALKTIEATLAEADAGLADIVSLRVYLAARDDVMAVSEVLGRTFRDPRPTNTTIICGFPAEEILVEIEAMALRRRD